MAALPGFWQLAAPLLLLGACLPQLGASLSTRDWVKGVWQGKDTPQAEYLIASQPRERRISVLEVDVLTRKVLREPYYLVTSRLREPCGLAVDHQRQRLYVADPKSKKVFMYRLLFGEDGLHVDEEQQFVAVRDLTTRWIAVDQSGTLFCTDERRNYVAEVPAHELEDLGRTDLATEVRPRHKLLYEGRNIVEVDKPGGIAVDGYNVYWGNREQGHPYGSLLMAPEDPENPRVKGVPGMISSLSKNVDKVYGVCATPTVVFYTGGARHVYGAKPGARGARPGATVLLDDYAQPRGCVWDGDGTVYLADKGGGAIWSFPASLHNQGLVQATKVIGIEDPYGIAMLRPSFTLQAVGFLRGGAGRGSIHFSILAVLVAAMHWQL